MVFKLMDTTKSTSRRQVEDPGNRGRLREISARYQAILTGLSRKSYWHLAKTLSTNMGLSKAFLEKQGLVSIRTLWIQTHYPAKAR
jgi:hypothetical protein